MRVSTYRATARHEASRTASAATAPLALLEDRRGTSTVQMLILVTALALGGVTGVRLLAGSSRARAECAGEQIAAMGGAAPCRGGPGSDLPGLAGARPIEDPGNGPGGSGDGGDLNVPVPDLKIPRRAADWWASLTPEQRAHFKEHRYRDLPTDLRGLPASDADDINRRRLDEDLEILSDRARDLAEKAAEDDDFVDEALQAAIALQNARSIKNNLDRAGPDAYLLTYDPFGQSVDETPFGSIPAGRAAIAYGNPDEADNTAIVVPGTTSSTQNMPMDSGLSLREQMDDLDGGSRNSVIVWTGYDAPNAIFPDAGFERYGEQGFPYLKDDVAGYQASHEQASGSTGHTTVVAHSYGSYVAGLALDNDMKIDDVVFIGSPGVGVGSVSDLGLDGKHVFVGRTEDDPIQVVHGWFGPRFASPYDPRFGATPFGTEGSSGHSEYYKENSESLENIGLISVGRYDRISPRDRPLPTPPCVPSHGVCAPPR